MKYKRLLILAAVLLLLGCIEFLVGLTHIGALKFTLVRLSALLVGFGPLSYLFVSLLTHAPSLPVLPGNFELGTAGIHLLIGSILWVLGWGMVARMLSVPKAKAAQLAPSHAAGKPLHPQFAGHVDFHWGTLATYGFGMLLAELAFIIIYTALVGKGTVQGGVAQSGLSWAAAFGVAFFTAMGIAFVGGFMGAAHAKRLATPESTLALLYFGLPIPIFLSQIHASQSEIRHLLNEVIYLSSLLGETHPELGYWLITAALALGLFLGINVGFIATASGRVDFRASYELFIASRHVSVFRPRLLLGIFGVLILGIVPPLLIWAILQASEAAVERTRLRQLAAVDPLAAAESSHKLKARAQTPTAMMTALAVGGVGVGVMALIIVLSVMSGFEADLQQKILGTNAHGLVLKYAPSMSDYSKTMDRVRQVRGVTGTTPFILGEVMISSEGNIAGSIIKGIEPKTVGNVTKLPEYILPGGKLRWLTTPEDITKTPFPPPFQTSRDELNPSALPKTSDTILPGLILGRELASSLRVVVGDRVNVVSPLGGALSPQGPIPKSRPFRIAGIFYSGMYEYDAKFVYIHLAEAQRFFDIEGATGIEVKVDDIDNARNTMKAIRATLGGYPYRTKDWGEMNRNLFAALRLEKLVMGIILSIIVIIAAGLIIATVIMLVLEKRKEIAVLKALGVPDGGIVKVFLAEGMQIGIAGGVLGLVAGLAWCFFIEHMGIQLDPQVYYIPKLPVRIQPFETALSVVIAILVTFLASIYPALKASQVAPVDGLKSE